MLEEEDTATPGGARAPLFADDDVDEEVKPHTPTHMLLDFVSQDGRGIRQDGGGRVWKGFRGIHAPLFKGDDMEDELP